jgi:hypothetical protein
LTSLGSEKLAWPTMRENSGVKIPTIWSRLWVSVVVDKGGISVRGLGLRVLLSG